MRLLVGFFILGAEVSFCFAGNIPEAGVILGRIKSRKREGGDRVVPQSPRDFFF